MDGIRATKQSELNVQNRKPENIVNELRKLSPPELAAARTHYEATHEGKTFEDLIDARGFDDTTRLRLQSLLDGDKIGERALAVRQGMREQKQELIEGALANPHLKSKDPDLFAAAQREQAAVEARVQQLDRAGRETEAIVRGQDPNKVEGRELKQQLAAYYMDFGSRIPDPKDSGELLDKVLDRDEAYVRREKEAYENSFAATEVRHDGATSSTTDLRRADQKGDTQTKARLLENLDSNSERDAIRTEYQARYGVDVLEHPQRAEIEMMARLAKQHGDDRPLSALQAEVAEQITTSADQDVLDVRDAGVKKARSPHVEHQLQQRKRDLQYSDEFAAKERFDQLVYNKNAGTTSLVDSTLEYQDEQLAPASASGQRRLKESSSAEEFAQLDANLTSSLDLQKQEKLAHAEELATAFTTMVKLGALLTAQPHLVMLVDAAANVGGMALKSATAGRDYTGKMADFDAKMGLVDAGVDLIPILGSVGRAASRVDDIARAEQLGKQVADDVVEHGATNELREEIVEKGLKDAAGDTRVADKLATSADKGSDLARVESAAAGKGDELKRVAEDAEGAGGLARSKHGGRFGRDGGTVGSTVTHTGGDMVTGVVANGVGAVGGGVVAGQDGEDIAITLARTLGGMFGADKVASGVGKVVGGRGGKILGEAAGAVFEAGATGGSVLESGAGRAANHAGGSRFKKRPKDVEYHASGDGNGGVDVAPTHDTDVALAPRKTSGDVGAHPFAHLVDEPSFHKTDTDHEATSAQQRPETPPAERSVRQKPAAASEAVPSVVNWAAESVRPAPERNPNKKRKTPEEIRAELSEHLHARGMSADPSFSSMHPAVERNLNTALNGDPIAKGGLAAQERAQHWALGNAGGDAGEFTNRYEYARAKYGEARERVGNKIQAGLEITPEKLSTAFNHDLEVIDGLGDGERMPALGPNPDEIDIVNRVSAMDRIGYRTKANEAYHAAKHQGELPVDWSPGAEPVQRFDDAAQQVVKNRDLALHERQKDGSMKIIMLKGVGEHKGKPKVLEAIIEVAPDGTTTMLSFGNLKTEEGQIAWNEKLAHEKDHGGK